MNENGKRFEILRKVVVANSVAGTWKEAVREWDVVGYRDSYADRFKTGQETGPSCVCTKEDLRHLFTIENRLNGKRLFPIGSSCIKRFGVAAMDDVVKRWQSAEKLFRAKGGRMGRAIVPLNGDYLSRDLLAFMLEMDVFEDNKYNYFDGYNDYLFMLDRFNERKDPTPAQKRKIAAILLNEVYPWLDRTVGKDGGFNYGGGGDYLVEDYGAMPVKVVGASDLQDGFHG